MKKKVLLLDTSFSAKPIYDFLLTTGYDIYVMGGNPDDALAKSVKNYIQLDYSKVDNVKSYIKDNKFDYLVPGGNDLSYKICSEVNEDFSFFNMDTKQITHTINNKEVFRKFSLDHHLHVPRIVYPEEICDKLPVIIKPVDAYSGHGMSIVFNDNEDTISQAIEKAKQFSKSDNYVIEEYVKGQLYSHSAFVVNGQILIDFIVEEHCNVNQFVVDTSRVVYDFDPLILDKIRQDILVLIQKLNLVDGVIHTQFICDANSFWIIEVTRRCAGDLYSKLIELSTGFPYAEYYAKPFINLKNQIDCLELSKNLIFRHTITHDQKCFFHSISMKHPLHILEFIPLSLTGNEINRSPFSRIGILFSQCESMHVFIELFNHAKNGTLYSIS